MEDTQFIAALREAFGDQSFTARDVLVKLPKDAYPDPVRYQYFGSHRFEKAVTVRSIGILLSKDCLVIRAGERRAVGHRWRLVPKSDETRLEDANDPDAIFD